MAPPTWYGIGSPALRSFGRPGVSEILPELLLGEYPAPSDAEWLRDQHRVTAVLSLQDDDDLVAKNLRERELIDAFAAVGLRWQRCGVADYDTEMLGLRIDRIVERLGEWIDAGERVFVHCNAGFNRAPTVAIAWLHARRGLELEAARSFVKERRPCAPYMSVLHARYATGAAGCETPPRKG